MDPGDGGTDVGLEVWAGELRVERAARERARSAWLARAEAEEASLSGALADLAARGRPVLVEVATGRRHRGVLEVLGADVVGVRLAAGPLVLVRLDAVVTVRTSPGERPAPGAAAMGRRATFAEAVGALVGTGVVAALWLRDGEALRGEVVATGTDVCVVRPASGEAVYVALASLAEVSVADSG